MGNFFRQSVNKLFTHQVAAVRRVGVNEDLITAASQQQPTLLFD